MDINELYEALRRAVWNYAANPTEQNVDACEVLSAKLEVAVKVRDVEYRKTLGEQFSQEYADFLTKFWEYLS